MRDEDEGRRYIGLRNPTVHTYRYATRQTEQRSEFQLTTHANLLPADTSPNPPP